MAKAITSPVAERRPTSAATWILLVVSVAVATLIAISVPRLVTEGGWATGEKFLYLTLIGYFGASAFYVSALVTRDASVSAAATALMRGSFLLHTTAIVVRWATAGQPPFSNIYEMVLMFAWGVVAFQIFAEWNMKLKFLGAVTLPVAALSLVLLQVMPGEIRPLVPALQSTWLHIHVALAVLSYAGFTLAFAAGVLYFLKDGTSLRAFLNWTAGIVAGIYGIIALTSVNGSWAFLLPAWDATTREKILMGPKEPLLVAIPGLGWPFLFATALAAAALALSLADTFASKPGGLGPWARRFFQVSIAAQAAALTLLIVKVRSGPYPVPQFGKSFGVHFASSPFLLAGMATALFASVVWLVLSWKHEPIVEHLPGRETLDNLIYKTIAISFPLLTMMIISGAYWANKTWGAYWSWDPKEDWALITWLTYAAYLHMRLTRGWRGRRAASMAIIGFAIVLFTFFGVTYLLPGLHAYA